jgi:hypothetical protein
MPIMFTNPGLNFLSGPYSELTDKYRVRCCVHTCSPLFALSGTYHTSVFGDHENSRVT